MEINELATALMGIVVSVVSYFLKTSMEEIKNVKEVVFKTKMKVEVLENDYLNKISALNEKFENLYKAIDRLTLKIENLNKKM